MAKILTDILLERADRNGGTLSRQDVEAVLERFETAPGQLSSLYEQQFKNCTAAGREQHTANRSHVEAFEARVRRMVDQGSPIVAGRLQMVRLDEIQAALGERWPEWAERAQKIARQVIQEHLAPDDAFAPQEDNQFVICFARLNEQQAWFKARTIADAIRERLLGGGIGDGGASPPEPSVLDALTGVQIEAHTLPPMDAKAGGDLLHEVAGSLDRMGHEIAHRAHALIEAVRTGAAARLRLVRGHGGRAAKLRLMDLDRTIRFRLAQIDHLIRANRSLSLELDLVMLEKAVALLARRALEEPILLVVDVGFATLTNKAHARRYLDMCRNLDPQVQDQLVLCLSRLPADPDPCAVAGALATLREVCMLEMLELDDHGPRLIGQTVAPPVFRVPYRRLAPLLTWHVDHLDRLVGTVHDLHSRLLVDHVPFASAGRLTRNHGIDLLAFD